MEGKELLGFDLEQENNLEKLIKNTLEIKKECREIIDAINSIDSDNINNEKIIETLNEILNETLNIMNNNFFYFNQIKEILALSKEIEENGIKRKCFEILKEINEKKEKENTLSEVSFEDLENSIINEEAKDKIINIKIKAREKDKKYGLVFANYETDGSLIQEIDGLKCFLFYGKYYQIVNTIKLDGKEIFISYNFDKDEYCLFSFEGENIEYLNYN